MPFRSLFVGLSRGMAVALATVFLLSGAVGVVLGFGLGAVAGNAVVVTPPSIKPVQDGGLAVWNVAPEFQGLPASDPTWAWRRWETDPPLLLASAKADEEDEAAPMMAPSGSVQPPGPESDVIASFDAAADLASTDLRAERRAEIEARLKGRPSLDDLDGFWEATGATLVNIGKGAEAEPLFLSGLPKDLPKELDTKRRKRAFIALMLPHILKVNEALADDRTRLIRLRPAVKQELKLPKQDAEWLKAMYESYQVDPGDIDRLVARVDVIPPALAIAQAAKETGWGTSRFSQIGNSLFGQWTWNPKDKGIVPKERPKGKTYRVRAFDDILGATRAYADNLNKTRAYGRFRVMRQEIRKAGKTPDGLRLTETLDKYSAIGQRYVRALKTIIKRNDLLKLNKAKLSDKLDIDALIDGAALASSAD